MTLPEPGIVYVIDDDDAVRDSLLFLFDVEGMRARGFADVEAFLQALPAHANGCVVSDMQMPGPDGVDLLGLLPERGVTLPVIVITGQGEVATALRVLSAGAFDFIEKPFQDAAILQSVRAALAAGKDDGSDNSRARETGSVISRFSSRDRSILEALVRGEPNGAISRRTGIPIGEIELIRAHIMERTDAAGLPDLIRLVAAARRLPDHGAEGLQTPGSL